MHQDADIPKEEPTEFTAGTTVKWRRENLKAHYPADASWILNYYLRGPGLLDAPATADGKDFAVTIAASASGTLAPGRYQLLGRVSKSGEVFEVYNGMLDVALDPAQQADNIDVRTIAKRILDAHLETYEQRASRRERSYTVSGAGRSFVYDSLDELLRAIDYWKAVVAEEDNPTGRGKNILAIFNEP